MSRLPSMSNSPYLFALTSVVIFGSVATCIRFVEANAFGLGIARLVIAITITTAILSMKGEFSSIPKNRWPNLVLLGLCFGLHWLFYFLAIKYSSASLGALSQSTYGVQLVILGWLFGLNSVSFTDILGVALAMFGSFLAVPELSFQSDQTIGLLCGIAGGGFFAILPILHQRTKDVSNGIRSWAQFFFAAPVFIFFLPQATWSTSLIDWVVIFYLGAVVTVIGHSFWVKATTELSTTASSVLSYLYLPTAMIMAWSILGETISLWMILGALLIILGNVVTLFNR